ncbi:MAG: ATP-binding protein, partial [Fimbriimonadaceae bacterium]
SLCDQFLEFARPLVVATQPLDPAAIIRRVIALHQAEFEAKGVNIQEEFSKDVPTIEADPLQLEQVCRNLMINALQACESGATVTLALDGSGLKVTDSGSGIEPTMMDKLFTPFFTTKAAGTGLGLSNIRKIADAHGWSISVESAPGKGARFSVIWEHAA